MLIWLFAVCGAWALAFAQKVAADIIDEVAALRDATPEELSGVFGPKFTRDMADERCGHLFAWSIKSGGRNREAATLRGVYRDPFGIFGDVKVRDGEDRAAFDRRLGKLERSALADLDLDMAADSAAIRVRYIEMVKRCHPDANGGDRSAEHKLQRVIKAYKTLQKAKLV